MREWPSPIDTTEDAIRSHRMQRRKQKSPWISGKCNLRQRPATGVVMLWLRRSLVRAPSVTSRIAVNEPRSFGRGSFTATVLQPV
jgi:hypothetical protein